MSKIYISGPISGHEETYMERFAKAQSKLESQGYSVINPALVLSNMPKDTTWGEYMKLCMVMLEISDAIYLLDDWEYSKGANMEQEFAVRHGKEIMFEYMEVT